MAERQVTRGRWRGVWVGLVALTVAVVPNVVLTRCMTPARGESSAVVPARAEYDDAGLSMEKAADAGLWWWRAHQEANRMEAAVAQLTDTDQEPAMQ